MSGKRSDYLSNHQIFHFKEHPLGWHFEREGLLYVYIPKCASSSVKEAMKSAGFEYGGTTWEYGRAGIAVVRNPLNRFVSGVISYFWGHHTTTLKERTLEEWLPETLSRIERREIFPVLDPHTQPQWQFLTPFEEVPMTLVPLAYLQGGIDAWFQEQKLKPPTVAVLNSTASAQTLLASELLTPELISLVNDYYERDWELYFEALAPYPHV